MPTHRLPRPPRPGLVLRAAVAAACLLALCGARAALAQLEAPATGRIGPETYRLDEEQVVSEHDPAVDFARFLPDVGDVEIYDGKKTQVIEPKELPKIANDNYRQALSRTPGLVLAEESTPLVSIGYRGFDPNRTQTTMVLKDGIPISADMIGYPENYYLPPIDSVDTIDFLHGGAALLYGPQPGGALNYVTRKPKAGVGFSLLSNQTWGSDSFFSSYDEVSGTVGRVGYDVYYYQKQGLGFRERNSDFGLWSGSAKTTYAIDDRSSFTAGFDGYSEENGEPGGLCPIRSSSDPKNCSNSPDVVSYAADRDAYSRLWDRFRLQRYVGWGIYENTIDPNTFLRVAIWGGSYDRWSRRQRGGGFGTLPTGEAASTTAIERQKFRVAGLDARVKRDWHAWGETHTLTTGVEYFHDDSPRTDRRGTTPEADWGELRGESFRTTDYGSAFAENRFVFGKFSFVPSIRLENYAQSIDESVNVDKAAAEVPLADESNYQFVPLVGLGTSYRLRSSVEIYANASSAYRPEIFTQAVPTSPNLVVPRNLKPTGSWQYEIGLRGQPFPWVFWDTSLFWIDVADAIGTVQVSPTLSEIRNTGRARRAGWEFAAEAGALGLVDHFRGSKLVPRFGDLALFANVMILDAKFTAGSQKGKTPAYAPDWLVRAGLQYTLPGRLKASLMTTAVAKEWGNDNNTEDFFIPSYQVWDLTFETDVWTERVALFFGVNNLFDENYWARVTSTGLDPAYERNFYGGLKVRL
ncbi:MAG: hypothetical protein RL698_1490 [Pseudomonadota bacterium]